MKIAVPTEDGENVSEHFGGTGHHRTDWAGGIH